MVILEVLFLRQLSPEHRSQNTFMEKNTAKMRHLIFILLNYFLCTVFLFGCGSVQTHNINIAEIGTYPQPLVKPLQVSLGVYYKDDFQKFQTVQNFPVKQFTLNILMGKANTALFDYLLPHVFEELTYVKPSLRESENIANIDLFIVPSLTNYSCYIVAQDLPNELRIEITYTIRFYSPKSEPISSCLTGNGDLQRWAIAQISNLEMSNFSQDQENQLIERRRTSHTPPMAVNQIDAEIAEKGHFWMETSIWSIKGEGFASSFQSVGTLAKEATRIAMREVAAQFMANICRSPETRKLFTRQCTQ